MARIKGRSALTIAVVSITSILLLLCLWRTLFYLRKTPVDLSPPPYPTRAFFITTKGRHESNWTTYTLDQLAQRHGLLNISKVRPSLRMGTTSADF